MKHLGLLWLPIAWHWLIMSKPLWCQRIVKQERKHVDANKRLQVPCMPTSSPQIRTPIYIQQLLWKTFNDLFFIRSCFSFDKNHFEHFYSEWTLNISKADMFLYTIRALFFPFSCMTSDSRHIFAHGIIHHRFCCVSIFGIRFLCVFCGQTRFHWKIFYLCWSE